MARDHIHIVVLAIMILIRSNKSYTSFRNFVKIRLNIKHKPYDKGKAIERWRRKARGAYLWTDCQPATEYRASRCGLCRNMEDNAMIKRASIVREWHQLSILFQEMLLEGCLDEAKRMEIYLKIIRHKNKLAGLALS